MAIICPTITSENTHQYREQMERVAPFVKRIHVDFMDGKFAPTKSPGLLQAWWPEKIQVDLHIMHQNPENELDEIVGLKPQLVIVHAEAGGNFVTIARRLHEADIKTGIALLADTSVDVIKPGLEHTDHVLIFSGDLGHFGGKVDVRLLDKVRKVRELKPDVEIGWDGGINDTNVKQLVEAGVDVLNVGGYIQRAENPKERFEILSRLIS
jgi:ribulose-phosphate 3-epimerase